MSVCVCVFLCCFADLCPPVQFVVFTFWSLYLYDRELVYPKLLDNFIPQWLNHGMVSSGGSQRRAPYTEHTWNRFSFILLNELTLVLKLEVR